MSETTQVMFDFKEVAELLVQRQDIKDGNWAVCVKFALAAANVQNPEGNSLLPAAIIPVMSIGIQRYDEPNSLTVDASKIDRKKVKAKKPKLI